MLNICLHRSSVPQAYKIMLQHLSTTHDYVVLDTHLQGYYKCPNAKIDLALSTTDQVGSKRFLNSNMIVLLPCLKQGITVLCPRKSCI